MTTGRDIVLVTMGQVGSGKENLCEGCKAYELKYHHTRIIDLSFFLCLSSSSSHMYSTRAIGLFITWYNIPIRELAFIVSHIPHEAWDTIPTLPSIFFCFVKGMGCFDACKRLLCRCMNIYSATSLKCRAGAVVDA